MKTDNTEKFIGKAEIYDKFRPAYPDSVYEFIINGIGLTESAKIADIGAGTGIFSEPLLKRGYTVYCVEPNADMKSKLNERVGGYANYIGVNGTAENTGLADSSVDLVVAAQAFHWFDRQAFKRECRRILKPNGKAVLLWNVRDTECGLNVGLDKLNRKFCPEFKGFSEGKQVTGCEQFEDFFEEACEMKIFENNICGVDFNMFAGRCLSSSYALKAEDKNYREYIAALRSLFNLYAVNDRAVIKNNTAVYWGKV